MIKFNPNSGRIIVKANKPQEGVVIAKGPLAKFVEIGDTIIYGIYSGAAISIDETEYLAMEECDVYASIERTEGKKDATRD